MLQNQSCKVTIPGFFLSASRDRRGKEAGWRAEEQNSSGGEMESKGYFHGSTKYSLKCLVGL